METVFTARHTQVPSRFQEHATEKLARVENIDPTVTKLHVRVTHEANPRQSGNSERIELTVHAPGPVIRAEASAEDRYAALDLALDKLMQRLRRAQDRKHDHRKGSQRNREQPPVLTGELPGLNGQPQSEQDDGSPELGESPVVIREKLHTAPPMSIDDALYQMELVGHDFYLFCDRQTGRPSVVYRRHGWSYGVLRLQNAEDQDPGAAEPTEAAAAG